MVLTTMRWGLALGLAGTPACARRPPPEVLSDPVPAAEVDQGVGTPVTPTAPLAGLDGDIEAIMAAQRVPGLSIVVVLDDEVVLARGYGTRTLGQEAPVGPDTVFAIASNTKAFVATAVGMLVEDGVLDWDDRVVEHLPDLKLWDEYTTQHIRVRDLLCHRSGLATWAGDLAWIGSGIDKAELLRRLRHVPPDHDLREQFGYTNLMFVVAGELLRVKAGQPWDAVVQARILDPLGMNRTSASTSALRGLADVATPYMEIGGELTAIDYLPVDNAGAAGALNSSANDLGRWLRAQLSGGRLDGKPVIPQRVVEALRVPHTPIERKAPKDGPKTGHFSAYGLGWFLLDRHGAFVVTHSGGLPGMLSRVTLVPEAGLGVAVLTNSETSASTFVANIVVDRFLGQDSAPELQRALRPADDGLAIPAVSAPSDAGIAPPPRLAGKYQHPLLGSAEVTMTADGPTLVVIEHGDLECPLRPIAADRYACPWKDPIFGTSEVRLEVGPRGVDALAFRVRPGFVDPLEYRFVRRGR